MQFTPPRMTHPKHLREYPAGPASDREASNALRPMQGRELRGLLEVARRLAAGLGQPHPELLALAVGTSPGDGSVLLDNLFRRGLVRHRPRFGLTPAGWDAVHAAEAGGAAD